MDLWTVDARKYNVLCVSELFFLFCISCTHFSDAERRDRWGQCPGFQEGRASSITKEIPFTSTLGFTFDIGDGIECGETLEN